MTTMRRGMRLLATAAVLWVATMTTGSAQLVGVGVVEANGTISPALTSTSQPVSGGWTGTFVGAVVADGTASAGVDSCSVAFNSVGFPGGTGDSLALASDVGSGSCSGSAGSMIFTENDTRVGAVEVDAVSGTINGSGTWHWYRVCVWVATSAPNVSSFDKICVWVPLPI